MSVASRDEVLIAGDQGRVMATKDGGRTWDQQPSLTSSPLYAVAYRGGSAAWVAGRGGAILRRTEDLATVKISAPKLPSALRGAPKLKAQDTQLNFDDDIPRAVRPDKKPQRP